MNTPNRTIAENFIARAKVRVLQKRFQTAFRRMLKSIRHLAEAGESATQSMNLFAQTVKESGRGETQ